ncbi:MAG TPA: metal-dependent transcriptional regulator, partial [Thermoanaerobaculia bacterium]|nr:metal-dependent transcriptional regulator [Thermoanaerobaculia bacterium]
MPTSTVEDYLKAILQLEELAGGELVGMGSVAANLGVAPGTVTSMMKALADGGLVAYEPYSGVRLTAAGRQLALHVLRRHRLIEQFLVQVMGMDWSRVHAEADRLEHAVSDE